MPTQYEHLVVYIAEGIDPLDRHDRYEKPVNRALRRAGRLGKCVGGGTGLSFTTRGMDMEMSYLDLEVKDVPAALPAIRDALSEASVPAGSVVGHPNSDTILLHFSVPGQLPPIQLEQWPLPEPTPRYPWSAGEVIGYQLARDCWALLHVLDNSATGLFVKVLEWSGPQLPSAQAIGDLVQAEPTRYWFTHSFFLQTSKLMAFPHSFQLTPPRGLNRRRMVRTGVTVDPPGNSGLVCSGNGQHFARSMKQVFGLVPVDGLTRLYYGLGLGPRHAHLAAWDPPKPPSLADARRLFYAYACNNFRKTHPDRVPMPVTDHLHGFVRALKGHFRKDDNVWGWGNFSAAEGFVVIPMVAGRLTEVWSAALTLASKYRITLYDPQQHLLACPPGATA